MKELTEKLLALMEAADLFRGIHTKVYDLGEFSSDYLRKVRRGENSIEDTPENKDRVMRMIAKYESEIGNAKAKLATT
jgi:hypothetical protein